MSNTIEQLVGQIIIAGFRGKTLEKDSDISKYITEIEKAVEIYDRIITFLLCNTSSYPLV